MLSWVSTLAIGCLFGLALAAPPGPMNAIIATESVTRSWAAGFKAGVGAMVADVLFFALTLVGVATIVSRYDLLESLLFLAGGLLMVVFAVDAFPTDETEFTRMDDSSATGFQKAFALSLTNPYQITFWLTAGVGLVRPGTFDITTHVPALERVVGSLVVETGSPALLIGFFAGIGCWITGFPATLRIIGHRVDAFAPLVALTSALVLAGFGVLFFVVGVGGIL